MLPKVFRKTPVALAVSAALLQSAAMAYESPVHVFSIDDVMGGFDGSTFGTTGAQQDLNIICGLGDVACPSDNPPFMDKSGVMLYPVDSEFGYYVVDFLGAKRKSRDGDYMEGYVGNITDEGDVIGIQVSNASTLKYKAKPPLGTWCQGLGGTTVKCETEHYVVMEHVQSCHEVIPYHYANEDGSQGTVPQPPLEDHPEFTFNCVDAPLDDNVRILVDGVPGDRLINSTPCEEEDDPAGCQMFPNDKTDMLNNIALSTDYSVQLKDDGKPLYGWGGIHKRPNDIRMYARLELPAEWKVEGADYTITKAQLVVNHWITNNPNDQLRPEDLENEGATGRKPSYKVEQRSDGSEVWRTMFDCFEGDGDFIEGDTPASTISSGTVLRDTAAALDPGYAPGILPEDPPYAFSSDLYGGFTNAFYTTINRDPFEWSYDADPDPLVQDFVGSPLPDETLGELISGPRWRLKPNKFGQDLPGLEIPLVECSPPPFQKENIKYPVGEPVTTVINLLDWNEEKNGPSPLSTSKGWVDVYANEFVEVAGEINGIPITGNGLPMTNDFDLAVYIKGDKKSTAVYNAQLLIEYEGEGPQPPVDPSYDLVINAVADRNFIEDEEGTISVTVSNAGPDDLFEPASVLVQGLTNRDNLIDLGTQSVGVLAEGETKDLTFTYTAPSGNKDKVINWTATLTDAPADSDTSNNVAKDRSNIKK